MSSSTLSASSASTALTRTALTAAVDAALTDAREDRSPLRDAGHAGEAVLRIAGMTGVKTRHLYNGLVRRLAAAVQGRRLRYLEVGTWGGSSLLSSLHGNEASVDAVVIDNWSEFNHLLVPLPSVNDDGDGTFRQASPREVFKHNVDTLLDPSELRLCVIEKDCFEVESGDLPFSGFDLYVYDGPHEEIEHERAITGFAGCLADAAVVVIDDWNWEKVRQGTWKGFARAGLRVHHVVEEFTPGNANMVAKGFWNGVALFVVTKCSARWMS